LELRDVLKLLELRALCLGQSSLKKLILKFGVDNGDRAQHMTEQLVEPLVVVSPDLHEPQGEERLVVGEQTSRTEIVNLVKQLLDEALPPCVVVAFRDSA
jgi:hypothetical protein